MKTEIKMTNDIPKSIVEKGDIGYIDGYVVAGDGRPVVAVVIPSKGIVELVSFHTFKATGHVTEDGAFDFGSHYR